MGENCRNYCIYDPPRGDLRGDIMFCTDGACCPYRGRAIPFPNREGTSVGGRKPICERAETERRNS